MNTFIVSVNDKVYKDQFIAALAHEVRNPLANITLSVDMLLSTLKEDSAAMYLDIIKRNTARINILIKQLLTDEYNNEQDSKNYPINQLLDEGLLQVEDRMKLKAIKVEKQYAPENYTIYLNVPKMKIALTNILINAIEAMDVEGGILTLGTKLIYGKYVIEVKDNGCGISKENVDKMFKVAFTSKPNGLGLGLTIINDILKVNHVAINIDSEEGKGTTFSLLFDKSRQVAATNITN